MSGFYPGYSHPQNQTPLQDTQNGAVLKPTPQQQGATYAGNFPMQQQIGVGFAPSGNNGLRAPTINNYAPPPPLYNINAGMKDMTLGGPIVASHVTSTTPATANPSMFVPGAPSFHNPPNNPSFAAPPPPIQQTTSVVPMHGQLHTPSPSPFYSPIPSASQVERRFATGENLGVQNTLPSAPDPMLAAGGDAFHSDCIDARIQVPSRMLRLTSHKLPATQAFATSVKVPVGGLLRPLAVPELDDEEEVDVVQPGAAGIVRCKRCRTYINPFVSWIENGRRWRCNICAQLNECPSAYFCHLDPATGHRRDELQRPELSKSVVEWAAPSEYMVRPPQPPAYFFIFDVSGPAIQSGMLQCVSKAIRRSLDELPGRDRTLVGFITYDTAVHYYLLKPGSDHAQMLVVGDLNELFVPAPVDLLVNLKDSRKAVDNFLEHLPTMFTGKNSSIASCLGPSLKAAFTVLKAIGGKMVVFQSSMPSLGDGSLKPRGNPNIMGTPDEVTLLRPSNTWYKETALEFSRCQIAVDLFLFPYQYVDCATLSDLPKFTSGSMFTYLSFHAKNDGPKLESQLFRTLTQSTAFEAVLRIRCTKGMKICNYYGNFYLRGADLLALPNCNADSTFGFDIVHDEQSVSSKYVSIQSALLYTSSDGERRIRVATHVLPVTNSASDFIASVDTEATITLMARQASDLSIKTNLDNARNRLIQTCADIIRFSKEGDKRNVPGFSMQPPGQHQGGVKDDDKAIPEHVELLPLYTLGLLKNVAFRGGTDVHPDERISAHMLLSDMFVNQTISFVHPKLFSIHDMDQSVGTPSPIDDIGSDNNFSAFKTSGRNKIILPRCLNLSVERLSSEGIFLLDNGNDLYLWVGRASNPALNNSLFGINSLESVPDVSQLKLNRSGNDLASRLDSVLNSLRETTLPVVSPRVVIIREGDALLESRFFWNLIEDRAQFNGGTYNYVDFMQFVSRSSAGMGMTGSTPATAGFPSMSHVVPPPPGSLTSGQKSAASPGPVMMGRMMLPPGAAVVPNAPPSALSHPALPGPPPTLQRPARLPEPVLTHPLPPGVPSSMGPMANNTQVAKLMTPPLAVSSASPLSSPPTTTHTASPTVGQPVGSMDPSHSKGLSMTESTSVVLGALNQSSGIPVQPPKTQNTVSHLPPHVGPPYVTHGQPPRGPTGPTSALLYPKPSLEPFSGSLSVGQTATLNSPVVQNSNQIRGRPMPPPPQNKPIIAFPGQS